MGLRLTHPPESVAELAERLLLGTATLRREEAILHTPRAISHPDTVALRGDHDRGLASATSMLTLALNEATGDWLDRGVARDITRRIITAYLDQIGGTR